MSSPYGTRVEDACSPSYGVMRATGRSHGVGGIGRRHGDAKARLTTAGRRRRVTAVQTENGPGGHPSDEGAIRDALRPLASRDAGEPRLVVDEFWIPGSRARADVCVISGELWGYEIKSARDTLRRLPRQVEAFSRLFDRCTAVLATKHLDAAEDILSPWWGIIEVAGNGRPELIVRRAPEKNTCVDTALVVKLLWRAEAQAALAEMGVQPTAKKLGRQAMWRLLVRHVDPPRLHRHVRETLLWRDPADARIPSRRFTDAREVAP